MTTLRRGDPIERPILFSAPMVRAILAGTKTQTRRVVKPQPTEGSSVYWHALLQEHRWMSEDCERGGALRCPYGVPGDRLWAREAWAVSHAIDHLKPGEMPHGSRMVYYAATEELGGLLKRPSIFMPRWASRITLEVTGVRVERLQDISEADSVAEGSHEWAGEQSTPVRDIPAGETRLIYRQLWESINGPGSWDANPWVWCVEFCRIEAST